MTLSEPPDAPILNLVGEKVALGPRRRDLMPLYLKWINDFDVSRTIAAQMRPMTLDAEEKWWEGASINVQIAAFTIYEKATMRPIGNTDLSDLNPYHRTAVFGLMIGEKECWGKGYGTETTRLMLDYGFMALDLHNIMLEVFSYNERAIRTYTRAGFKEIGRRREAIRFCGKVYDEILMDCLSTEFEGTVMQAYTPEEK